MVKPPQNPIELVTQIESVRLTNWFLRTWWKAIALTLRLVTSIVIAVVHASQRRRNNW